MGAMKITNSLIKDSNDENNKDFIFGLVHHAIRGVAGVAHHAIGAVRGVAHHLLGDEDKQDYYYGYHPYHHYGHHHYYYGDDVTNDDFSVMKMNNKPRFFAVFKQPKQEKQT